MSVSAPKLTYKSLILVRIVPGNWPYNASFHVKTAKRGKNKKIIKIVEIYLISDIITVLIVIFRF